LARFGGYVLPPLLGIAVLLLWRPGLPVPFLVAALWVVPAALLIAWSAPMTGPIGFLRRWLIAGWLAGTVSLAFLWPLHVRAELTRAEREIGLLGMEADPFLDFLLRQFADQASLLARQDERGVNLLYHAWVGSGLAREGYEARISLWNDGEVEAELNLSELPALPGPIVDRIIRTRERPSVERYQGED